MVTTKPSFNRKIPERQRFYRGSIVKVIKDTNLFYGNDIIATVRKKEELEIYRTHVRWLLVSYHGRFGWIDIRDIVGTNKRVYRWGR